MFLKCSYIPILVIRYSSTVEKSITVGTSVQYSAQKYDHLTVDRVMTVNIKSLVFYVIKTPFPFYKNKLNFSYKMGLYWPNFSLVFLIHLFLHAGVYYTTQYDTIRSPLPGASIFHTDPLSKPCPVSFYF